MMDWHFDSYEYFIASLQRFSKYFSQCETCWFFWINSSSDYQKLSEEDFILLQKCLVDLNNWRPDIDELKEVGLFISHSYCEPCFRKIIEPTYRKRQKEEGNPDCFGKANDGNCTQGECKYYRRCVLQKEVLARWFRVGRLFKEANIILPIAVEL
jgi:hypothetical protein